MERIRATKTAGERYPDAMLRLRRLIAELPEGSFNEQHAALHQGARVFARVCRRRRRHRVAGRIAGEGADEPRGGRGAPVALRWHDTNHGPACPDARGDARRQTHMRDAGLGVVRFNFLYKGKKSGRPDPMLRLMDTSAAVVAHVRAELKPSRQIIGGRSMGGRAARCSPPTATPPTDCCSSPIPCIQPGSPKAARRAPAAHQHAGTLLQRNARRALHTRADGARAHHGDRTLGHAVG